MIHSRDFSSENDLNIAKQAEIDPSLLRSLEVILRLNFHRVASKNSSLIASELSNLLASNGYLLKLIKLSCFLPYLIEEVSSSY